MKRDHSELSEDLAKRLRAAAAGGVRWRERLGLDPDGYPLVALLVVGCFAAGTNGCLATLIYPRYSAFAALCGFVFGLFMGIIPPLTAARRGFGALPVALAGLVGLASALLLGAFVASLRACVLLHERDQPAWSSLAHPDRWWALLTSAARLPVQWTSRGFLHEATPFDHWLFVGVEQAGFLAGGTFGCWYAISDQRRRASR